MLAARQLGLPVVDGDYAGRLSRRLARRSRTSSPQHMLVHLCGSLGNVIVVKEATSTAMIDRIGRMFCLAGYGGVSFAGFGYRPAICRRSACRTR
jgi:DUF917 family protein